MLLAIDSGNTNAVFAIYEGDERKGAWRAATDPARTADEYASWLLSLMALAGLSPRDIDAAIIGSVVPESTFHLSGLCRRYFTVEPLLLGEAACEIPVKLDLEMRKEEVGADRIANAVAARDRYPAPLIIVDFGTATTFDVIDRAGSYCGGVIAPGLKLSLKALEMAAAQLPLVAIEKPRTVVGRSTISAMQSGMFWGYVGLIEGIVTRIRAERGEKMGVIATGGLASLIAGATKAIDRVDPDLTLWGLRLVHRFNSNR